MNGKLDRITLTGMRFFAFHGCLEWERQHGNDFQVDLECSLDLSKAAESDALEDSIDYSELYRAVCTEMEKPSNLLEHVAGRIGAAIKAKFPQIAACAVTVTKFNPPYDGKYEPRGQGYASVTINC
ncbi:MAG: dihydroneopterin aldolase [Bacteroidales bacterium]|nr:dihydroneopterin aldolase [Bacteroidales bacterium]MBO7479647.1 dihydroneopterin aldolase [Bacteroidales bacterium]